MRTVAFKTFGCRLNQAETVAFEQAFAAAGFRRVRFGEPAEVVVVHSCVVTQTAENECLRQLRTLRRKWPTVRLVLSGCAAEAVPQERLLAAGADLVVGRAQREVLCSGCRNAGRRRRKVWSVKCRLHAPPRRAGRIVRF